MCAYVYICVCVCVCVQLETHYLGPPLDSEMLQTARDFAVGMCVGFTATCFNAPFDVVKSRVQVSSAHTNTHTHKHTHTHTHIDTHRQQILAPQAHMGNDEHTVANKHNHAHAVKQLCLRCWSVPYYKT